MSEWWRCNRRIVADQLMARDEKIFHLMDSERIVPAALTKGVRVTGEGTVAYRSTVNGNREQV